MKKLTLLLVTFFASLTMFAGEVTEEQALQIAQKFVLPTTHQAPAKRASKESSNIVYKQMMPGTNRVAFYIINVGDNAFVLVSADDVAEQILGYSLSKNFPVGADGSINLPPHIKGFFNDLAAQMKVAADGTPNQVKSVKKTSLRRAGANLPASVDPLITTTWDQGQYYNALCPSDDNGPDGHAWTGCVATAMAQIVKYWGNSTHSRGIHNYDSDYGNLEVNYETSALDFSLMPNALTAESSSAQVNAVATLMYQCGVACNMSYGSQESSSYDADARAGFVNFFGFSPNTNFVEKAFFSDDDWNTLLRENLAAHHPVMYSGQSDGGGHSFICDGYKADNYFHFNFGWGGFCDGWFLTSAIAPGGTGYNSSQSALINLVPEENGRVILGQMKGNSTFTVSEPMEFYNLMGHNAYEGNNYSNPCNNTVTFKSTDATKQVIADIQEFEDQSVGIYDGINTNNTLRNLVGGSDNDISPVVSTTHALTLDYSGNMYYAGFKLIVSQESECRMVSDIVSSLENTTVHLTWKENGTATQWQIEYGVKGFGLGSGTVYNTTTNTVTFENLQKFTEYDFYIRSVKGSQYSQWNKISLMVEAPYWRDVVTSQPEGYILDEANNTVEISTAEALAWWAKTDPLKNVILTADIDLSAYKWTPIVNGGNFNGNGHVISNLFVIEPTTSVGFFSDFYNTVENVGFKNLHVKGTGGRTGGLCGLLLGTIRSCYIMNGVVEGRDNTGGLVGEVNNGTIINSFANVYTSGTRWASMLIGNNYQGVVKNCYAAGSFRQRAYCYNGGIAAYSDAGTISSCYSVEVPMGVVGFKGGTIITDTATFVKTEAACTLLTPVVIDGEPVTDLLTALNGWVGQNNDAAINTWIADVNQVNGGYPIFGKKHVVQCPNVSDITIQNVKTGNKNSVSIGWTENGNATKWQIRYRRKGVTNATYTTIETTSNPAMIQNIPLGYVYEFNVRAKGEGELKSGWSETQYAIVDLLYWTDVVKEQPAGYVEDAEGNVTISSTEGLAWLAVKVNGLHDQECNTYEGKTVTLTADLNLDGYRWYPIGGYYHKDWLGFSGVFDGQGHSISNIYINDACSDKGLFGYVYRGSIKNVNMVGGSVASILTQLEGEGHSASMSAIGGLVGFANFCQEITNCHSSVNVTGIEDVGSLCGAVDANAENVESVVSNCSASGTVSGRQSCGGLVGSTYGLVTVRNSFATGDVVVNEGERNTWYRGGLIGHTFYSTILNCYSTGTVYYDPQKASCLGNVIGCPEDSHIHYLYGRDDINTDMQIIGYDNKDATEMVTFHHEASQNTLSSPVVIDGNEYSDLNEVLNAWVKMKNESVLRTWIMDNKTGYPILGDEFVTLCSNPTDLMVSNATIVGNTTIQTKLSWNQSGKTTSWEVLYVAAEHDVKEGVIVPVTSNPCVLKNIPIGKPLDFYVRAVNGSDKSSWSKPMTHIPDKLHWTEVVTSQPEGYREDDQGNIYLSSAEGLAWLSSVMNGLNGASQPDISDKNIYIMADIDMNSYRWTPIDLDGYNVNGNNHTILGLYCNELRDYMGFIGRMNYGSINNLNLMRCNVYGENYVGTLVANSTNVAIDNCCISGNVQGLQSLGGIAGHHSASHIANSSFVGNVSARSDISKVNTFAGFIGGICGSPDNDSIMNCYLVCEVPSDGSYSGIITGTGFAPKFVSNCYYKQYETTLPATSDKCVTANNSSFTGSGTSWTLKTSSYVNGAFRSDLLDALNAWVNEKATDASYSTWMEDTEIINGGFPIFALRHYDVGDVVKVVNFTMNEDADPDDVAKYDMNNDLELNIGDIILVVKNILNQENSADMAALLTYDMTNLPQYTAVQFEVKVPEGMQVNHIRPVKGMTNSHNVMSCQTSADTYTVVVYSLSNELLKPENDHLIEIDVNGASTENLEVKNMVAANRFGKTVRIEGSAIVTDIKDVGRSKASDKVYDLRGIRHNDAHKKGLYIINGKKAVVK